jgi:hypothetical protein
MPRRSPRRAVPRDQDALFAPRKPAKKIPFEFVLDEIAELAPRTRPMFGCTAVYVDDKIVFVLRDKASAPEDNGVWMATTHEHHASLRQEVPCMRSVALLGSGVTGWQVLPAEADDFETCVLNACALVRARDERIGKVPTPRRKRSLPGRKGPGEP